MRVHRPPKLMMMVVVLGVGNDDEESDWGMNENVAYDCFVIAVLGVHVWATVGPYVQLRCDTVFCSIGRE